MKKILSKIAIMSAMAFMFFSCQDWLDMPSESAADSSSIFTTLSRAEMTVMGAYPYLHTQELGYQLLQGTDESNSTESNSKWNVSNYDYTATATMLNATYTTMYKAIEFANVCIKNLPLVPAVSDDDQRKRDMLLGECYAIRAYAYWNIVRFYGDVPFSIVPTSDLSTFSSSRVDRDIIWDSCVNDLQEAVKLLPWKSEGMVTTTERFTKNSAYGILARVALYAAGHSLRWDLNTVPYDKGTIRIAKRNDDGRVHELNQIAANACKAVIDKGENSLLRNYDQIFRDFALKQYNEESIFEYGWFGANSPDVRTGYTNGIPTVGTIVDFGRGGTQMITTPTLFFEFEDGDQRRDVSVCNYGLKADATYQMNTYIGNGVGKYRLNWKSERGTSDSRRDINFPILRYADVLLMYAEALNEINNGPNEDAKSALRQVRLRAFSNDDSKVGTIPTSYDEFKEAIVLERKLELSNEGLRKSDLARWGILYDHLTVEKNKVYQLARREGKYADVEVYRAYKQKRAVFNDPTIAVSSISLKESDFSRIGLTIDEVNTLNVLNDAAKGYLVKTFYEDNNGNVYLSQSEIPSAIEVSPVSYTILNMFGCCTIKSKGGLSVDKVDGFSDVNLWITDMFYGMQKNMVEIMPFATTSIIDVNPGLTGQQHPCY